MSSPTTANAKRTRLSTSRTSLSGRTSLQGDQSGLPRPTSAAYTNRVANAQPTYDLLTGGSTEGHPPVLKRSAFRQSHFATTDEGGNEELRAQINTLNYELDSVRQERSLLSLQHEKELRSLQVNADGFLKKAQASENAAKKASEKYDSLARELRNVQDQSINEKAELERRLRDLQDQNQTLREEVEDAQGHLADQERQYKYQINETETKRATLQETLDKVRDELQLLRQNLETTQERLVRRDVEVEGLEAQIGELKSHSADSEALSVVQRELSDQVTHIRKLESTSREQSAELRRLRDAHKAVGVIEEQKRSLETELLVLRDVHKQLGEAQIQKEILEDERRIWTTLLEIEGHEGDFESPEAVARALVQERIEHASAVDRLGKVEAELLGKDEMNRSLESELAALKVVAEKTKATATAPAGEGSDQKAYKRLDRQRTLAVKEVEYLRAQLKTFDTEETVMMSNENFDAQKSLQIQQLESLVDQYRSELQTLHAEILKKEQETSQPAQPLSDQQHEPRGTKRPAESQEPDSDATSSQIGGLLRKNKNLQTALVAATQKAALLTTEVTATKSQLKTLSTRSRTRILQLNSNPTSDAEAIKLSTLSSLRTENHALLAQLRGEDLQGIKMLPASTVDNLQLDLQDMQKVVAEKEKRMRRLKEIWTNKATEFRDLIVSVLGYKVDFLPSGKVRVTSMYHMNRSREGGGGSGGGGGENDEAGGGGGGGEEQSIIFDGDQGTMKISSAAFEREIKDLVQFWVQERKEIPCFLAAMVLEGYEKQQSA